MTPVDKELEVMTRRTIVRYAGIVQDFNPVHYDDEFARETGLPGIIAQGPLTFTILLDALVGSYGAEAISGMKARLKAPVFVGDKLHLNCDAAGNISATVAGKEVLSGSLVTKA